MNFAWKKSLCVFLLLGFGCHPSLADDTFVIETSSGIAPYSIAVGENGENKGLVLEAVLAAMKKAGLEVRPPVDESWNRAQEEAKRTPNSLLFTYARTPTREPTVKWVATILDEGFYLYTREDAPVVSSFDEIKKLKSIGVLLGSGVHTNVKNWGIEDVSQPVNDESLNAAKLASNHLDGWIAQSYMANYAIKKAGVQGKIKQNYKIADVPMWVATSLSTTDENVEKIRKAIEDFKKTAEYKQILLNYQ